MDFNFDSIISDKYDWSIVDKAIHDEVVRLKERISHLETAYVIGIGEGGNPTVLENNSLLTVAELAQVVVNYDPDICPFCEKGESETYLFHQEGCLFAVAYWVLRTEAEEPLPELPNGMDAGVSAVEMAQSLGIDNAVRTVAKSGKNHDSGPNWYAEWGDMHFSATFGAGTNSATVSVVSMDVETNHLLLYHADEYGRHIDVFRNGPWVSRLLNWASILQADNEKEAQRIKAQRIEAQLDKFKEVDF
jgi:hypothetical protein